MEEISRCSLLMSQIAFGEDYIEPSPFFENSSLCSSTSALTQSRYRIALSDVDVSGFPRSFFIISRFDCCSKMSVC